MCIYFKVQRWQIKIQKMLDFKGNSLNQEAFQCSCGLIILHHALTKVNSQVNILRMGILTETTAAFCSLIDRTLFSVFVVLFLSEKLIQKKFLQLTELLLFSLLFFTRVLRDNPLVCSCDLFWLQQWQRNERGDLDNQMLSCFSDNQEIPLNFLVIDNCSEFGIRFDICKNKYF